MMSVHCGHRAEYRRAEQKYAKNADDDFDHDLNKADQASLAETHLQTVRAFHDCVDNGGVEQEHQHQRDERRDPAAAQNHADNPTQDGCQDGGRQRRQKRLAEAWTETGGYFRCEHDDQCANGNGDKKRDDNRDKYRSHNLSPCVIELQMARRRCRVSRYTLMCRTFPSVSTAIGTTPARTQWPQSY